MARTDPTEAFLKTYQPHVRDIALRLRDIVRQVAPRAEEKVQTGWKTIQYMPAGGSMKKRCGCAISPMKDRVNFYFPGGASLPDPDGLLEGTGKGMRHIKVRTPADIKTGAVKALIRAAMTPPTTR